MSGLEIRSLSVGTMDNNVYILTCPITGKRLLVDPANDADAILDALGTRDLELIVITHGDRDHFLALDEIRAATDAPVAMHADDVHLLDGRPADGLLRDGDVVLVGECALTVLHTPGHTAGSICLYAPPLLIAGDTLFPGGPGLTKRPGGDFALIVESIRAKLFTLPEATIVYPGHGRSTTIGAEKPHLGEWIERGW
jgi:glyoxylase-like metal-dependent hydrolase (beta-lactamase superfamily II)